MKIDGLLQDGRLAAHNLRRNTNRTLVAIATVASGVIAYLLAGGFIAWIFHDMREATIHSRLGHVQIVRPAFHTRGIAAPYAFLLPAAPDTLSRLGQLPGVAAVTERLVLDGLVSRGETTLPFSGEGIDPVKEKPVSTRLRILAGSDMLPATHDVLLGEGLARSLGAAVGDRVVLLVKTPGGSANAVELNVSGIFATVTKEYDDHALRLPLPVARKLLRVDGATSWVMLLDDTALTEATVARVRALLPATQFEVVPWTALADFYNKTVVLLSRQVEVVKLIIALIIVLTITNTLTMNVLERTTEIGTSLAVGIPVARVMRLFVIEGAMIGVLGGLTGIGGGLVLARIVSLIGIPMPPPPGMAHGYDGQIILTGDLLANAVLLALLTTLLASAYPAWKAGRLNIVDALRYGQ